MYFFRTENMETHSLTRWKCQICGKIVSSKQNVVSHIQVLHPDCDKTLSNICKVQINVTDKKAKQPKDKSSLNKKSVAFSTQLSKGFSDSRALFEYLSFGKAKPAPAKVSNGSGPSTGGGVIPAESESDHGHGGGVGSGATPPRSQSVTQPGAESVKNPSLSGTNHEPEHFNPTTSLSNPRVHGFHTPFKTRGHCGDNACTGCNRSPCGSCYNCQHKKEVK